MRSCCGTSLWLLGVRLQMGGIGEFEMGKLIAILDILAEHYAAEVDRRTSRTV